MCPGSARGRLLAGIAALAVAGGAGGAPEAPPPCPGLGDAPTLREGSVVSRGDVLRLKGWIPGEVWRLRDVFFHAGMALEIGPCRRHYSAAAAYEAATARQAGSARVDAEGNLHDYRGGLPFPPESIDPDASDAGIRWAWNLALRHRGPGIRGRFRLVDLPSRVGGVQTYEGDWSFYPRAEGYAFIAGGRFREPHTTRHLAWHQLRPIAALLNFETRDDIQVYAPDLSRVRRSASSWVDGLFVPRYRAKGSSVTLSLRRGLEGLALRPNAYRWRVLDVRDVLAPLNVTRSGYPLEAARNFGPSGLSVGDDRWEIRRAVVIQGASRVRDGDFDYRTLYVDAQTQQPLYVLSHRRGMQLVEVGILLHRYTGDLSPGPLHSDGTPVRAFAPVAAVFYEAQDGGSGWRRESYELRLSPPSPQEIQDLLSQERLTRRH